MSTSKSTQGGGNLKSIATLIRSIVLTHKQPCKLREILGEYREYENKPLPYSNLGYRTAEELLRDTGEFIFHSIGSEIYITAKPNPKSNHIASLVRNQKKSKFAKEVRKPRIINDNRNNNHYNNNYNYTNYFRAQQQQQQYRQQQRYQLKQEEPLKQQFSVQQSIQKQQEFQPSQKVKVSHQYQQQHQQKQSKQLQEQQQHNIKQQPQSNDLRDVLNAKVKQQHQQQFTKSMAAEVKTPRPILGQNNSTAQQSHKASQSQSQSQQKQMSDSGRVVAMPQNSQPKSMQITSIVSGGYPPKSGIQNRLKLTITSNNDVRSATMANNNTTNGGGAGLKARLHDTMQKPYDRTMNASSFLSYDNLKMDPIRALTQYTIERDLPEPVYTSIKSKYSNQFQCRVEVNGSIYSTYPNEYPTEISAKIASAQKAIEQIRHEAARRPLPLCMDTDNQLIGKIYDEMLSHPYGVFAENLPEWYEEIFEESLPSHWWSLITTSTKFTIEKGASESLIVLANTKAADKDDSIGSTIQMDPIKLPWKEQFWPIYVTHCESTVEIWARLISENQRFQQLLSDIGKYMEVEKSRPVSIACKNMYLVLESDSWHRVRVEEVNKAEGTALCFYIDFGDVTWLAVDQLYICEPRFLQLPAQAIAFSLFGLEDFAGNPNAQKPLLKLLSERSLIGEVLTKEADFAGKIQVFLRDTNSKTDIELNPLLFDEICNNTVPPEMIANTLQSVLVTHVNNEGDVYLQLVTDPGWTYVQKLTQRLIESKFKREQHQATRDDLRQSKKLFLICDDGNGSEFKNDDNNTVCGDNTKSVSWYRGVLSTSNYNVPYAAQIENVNGDVAQQQQQSFDMYFVDFGETRRIPLSNIFRLDQLSAALSKYPAQAIKVRLHEIPEITPSIVGRMRALLPPRCEAMAKRKSPETVYIYRRFDTLCLINEAIRVEHEMSVSSPLDDNDDSKDALKISSNTSDNIMNGKKILNNNGNSISGGSQPTTPTTGKPFIDLTRGLTIVTDSPKKTNEIPKLKDYNAIPALGEFFEVRVTMSANPSNFTIQPYKDYSGLRMLMKELQEYCETSDEFIPVDMVERGQAYAAKNPDGFYHRVTVVDKYINDMIHIYYCDFGDIAILSNAQLKTLPARFRSLPKMALQAKLHGIAAQNGGDWTLDDCLRFRELTVGLKFVSTIKKISLDTLATPNTQILELELIDVTTDEDVLIHEILLKEDRAIKLVS